MGWRFWLKSHLIVGVFFAGAALGVIGARAKMCEGEKKTAYEAFRLVAAMGVLWLPGYIMHAMDDSEPDWSCKPISGRTN